MTPPDSGERCACPPSDRALQSRGLLLRHVKACPLRTVLNALVPDSGEREGRCPTADEAERFEHIDSLAPFCAKCCRHHGYVPPLPPASFTTIPWHLAQRILAALEAAGRGVVLDREMVRALAAELRLNLPKEPK